MAQKGAAVPQALLLCDLQHAGSAVIEGVTDDVEQRVDTDRVDQEIQGAPAFMARTVLATSPWVVRRMSGHAGSGAILI